MVVSIIFVYKRTHRVFARNVVGCHVGAQVVPMIIIYQQKILFTYFDLNYFTSITNIKLIKFQGNAYSSLFVVVKVECWYDHRIKPLSKDI